MTSIKVKIFNARVIKTGIIASSLFLVMLMAGCSDVDSLVRNKAEATIDGHQVVIRPCRNSSTRTVSDTPTNRQHVFSCGDRVKVEIRNQSLTVNGRSYGLLAQGDTVEVYGDKVLINKKETAALAMK